MNKKQLRRSFVHEHIVSLVALVLIWRGMWFLLDYLDALLFPGARLYTSGVAIVVGLTIIYLSERK